MPDGGTKTGTLLAVIPAGLELTPSECADLFELESDDPAVRELRRTHPFVRFVFRKPHGPIFAVGQSLIRALPKSKFG
jgi:hypothetical protein